MAAEAGAMPLSVDMEVGPEDADVLAEEETASHRSSLTPADLSNRPSRALLASRTGV